MITISQILQLQFDEFFSFLLFRYFLLDFSCFMQESLLNKKKKVNIKVKIGNIVCSKIEFISLFTLLHRIEFHDEISIFFRFMQVY